MKRHIRIKINSTYYNKPTTSSVRKHVIILDCELENQLTVQGCKHARLDIFQ